MLSLSLMIGCGNSGALSASLCNTFSLSLSLSLSDSCVSCLSYAPATIPCARAVDAAVCGSALPRDAVVASFYEDIYDISRYFEDTLLVLSLSLSLSLLCLALLSHNHSTSLVLQASTLLSKRKRVYRLRRRRRVISNSQIDFVIVVSAG